ncbi:hypothetical protein CMV_012187 [Castanea mollissima]|uniref:Protein kinase domain-containing protein n=1 Tax=Castanea mollissima TaxID=60419 RepID=A0A8J4R2G8_9ROSI|nr:hypothetical protein CMV_012187 [Castanea mollissima]
MAFKKTVIHDPNSALANWEAAVDVCNFTGVTCNKKQHRVAQLSLNKTELVGLLSPILSNLTGLRILVIVGNHLFGKIPPEFCYLRRLHRLHIEGNNLHGSIPDSFALLSKLTTLLLNQNNLSGTLPPSLFSNCSLLHNIDFSNNFLTGEIPIEIGNCQVLWNLNLYSNQLTRQLPFSLANASQLYNIDVEYNFLFGELPSNLVGNLPELALLHLSYNKMVSHDNNTNLDPFFIALGNCTKLRELELAGMGLGGRLPNSIGQLGFQLNYLLLQENQIFGSIPPNLANLSNLLFLNLTYNLLNGRIPAEISQLTSLQQLFLSHNLFTSAIPPVLGKFSSHLGLLDLSHNQFSGEIPAILGNLVRINYLFLNNNLLSGMIPPTLGQCIDLNELDLSYNRLTGSIPPELAGMSEIRIFINLSHNHLEGPLPIELSKLANVQEVDLSSNKLTGSIFPQISSCIALRMINFSNNSLEGRLPESLGELKNLESFDVSRNQLSGMIPMSLNKTHSLTYLNLSLNNFEGLIPTGGIFDSVTNMSFLDNHRLCRVIIHSQKTRTVRKPTTPELIHNIPRITYKELSDATSGFDDQRLVGSGSFGRVYRGVLPDGTAIAVKVLHMQSGNSTKSFNRECQVLKRIRHRNLIRIITACSLPDFKALVLPYMANGSLDCRLYLHSDTGLRSVMTAGGGNGAAAEMGNSTANLLCGSIGYIAPEYGYGSTTSTKGDVYSFGILVLEMVTRKRPTDDMFVGGLSLHRWVKSHYHGRIERVIDPSLVGASRDQSPEVLKMWEVAIGELIELGILCTQDSPSTRPSMLDAADDLDRLKRYLCGDTTATFASSLGISSSTLGDD